jgi:hypothetical protein
MHGMLQGHLSLYSLHASVNAIQLIVCREVTPCSLVASYLLFEEIYFILED